MPTIANRKPEIELSIVIPAMNEQECIENTLSIISNLVQKTKVNYEIIVVDDGSTDETLSKLIQTKKNLRNIRIITSKKNQGHMSAISEGMNAANGKYVCTIDADLQDPPEAVMEMFNIAKNHKNPNGDKYSVVQAIRTNRKSDSFFKRRTAALYYYSLKKITGVEIFQNAADFRIMDREAVSILLNLPERNKVFRLLIPALGMNTFYYEVIRGSRSAGKTKYTLRKMFALTLDSVVTFSNRPLRVISIFGLSTSAALFLSSGVSFLLWAYTKTVPGWTSLILLILSSNALLFASIGVLGEYIGRIYEQNQNRPKGLWREIK